MQRSSGALHTVVPSAQKPPRPPSRNRVYQMETVLRDEGCYRDLEKGDKGRWRFKPEQAVHLIPVVLLTCLLVLYICSSVPFHGSELPGDGANQMIIQKTVVPERHLQQANIRRLEEERIPTLMNYEIRADLPNHPSDLPVIPVTLRGATT